MPHPATYISADDLIDAYGSDAVVSWSRKGGDADGPDADALALALSRAASLVNSRLSRLYVLPLRAEDGVSELPASELAHVTRIALPLAAYELYTQRGLLDEDATGNKLSAGRAAALEDLQLYATGVYPLRALRIDRIPVGPQVVP